MHHHAENGHGVVKEVRRGGWIGLPHDENLIRRAIASDTWGC